MEQDQRLTLRNRFSFQRPRRGRLFWRLASRCCLPDCLPARGLTVLGAVLTVVASVGWFRDVLPHEHHESVPVEAAEAQHRYGADRGHAARPGNAPIWLAVEIYPVTAGVKGGLAGSVAMAVLACAYGLLSHRSIWYPINLAGGSRGRPGASAPHGLPDVVSSSACSCWRPCCTLCLHPGGSALRRMLPMFPRRPILLGGLIAPSCGRGCSTTLGIINPLLDQRIDW